MFKNITEFSHIIKLQIKNSDIANRMANGALWTFTGTVCAKLIVLVGGIICAHILGKTEYGEFGMVKSTINMFVMFGSAGLGTTATKYIAEYKQHNKEKITQIYATTNIFAFTTACITVGAILYFTPYIAVNMLKSTHLIPPIRIGALLLFITVLNAVQNGTLAGVEDFKATAINTFIGNVFETIFMLIGAYYAGVSGAILGFGTGFIALYICNLRSISLDFKRLEIKRNLLDVNKDSLKILCNFTIPAALASFLVMPTYWIIRSMLVNKNGFAELATYEIADQWKVIILFIPTAVSQIILPILSSLSRKEDVNKYKKVLKLNLLANGLVTFIVAFSVCLISKFIMRLYGSEYTDYITLIILSLSTIFNALANVVGLSISSRAKMWTGFGFNLIWASIILISTYLFLDMGMGAKGIALATLIAYAIHTTLQLIYIHNITKKI